LAEKALRRLARIARRSRSLAPGLPSRRPGARARLGRAAGGHDPGGVLRRGHGRRWGRPDQLRVIAGGALPLLLPLGPRPGAGADRAVAVPGAAGGHQELGDGVVASPASSVPIGRLPDAPPVAPPGGALVSLAPPVAAPGPPVHAHLLEL